MNFSNSGTLSRENRFGFDTMGQENRHNKEE